MSEIEFYNKKLEELEEFNDICDLIHSYKIYTIINRLSGPTSNSETPKEFIIKLDDEINRFVANMLLFDKMLNDKILQEKSLGICRRCKAHIQE